MRRSFFAAWLVAVGLIPPGVVSFGLTPTAARAAAPAGHVIAVAGQCTADHRPLHPGDPVGVGQAIAAPADCGLRLQMADGTGVSIAPGSSLTVTHYQVGGDSRDAEVALAQGLIRLAVPPVAGSSSFTVTTPTGTATMRSVAGDWFVSADASAAQVGVLAGSVALSGAGGSRSVVIPAHWGTRLELGLAPMLPRTWSQVEFDGFIRRTECCQSPSPK